MNYATDTIESKLKNFKGQDIAEFLNTQIEYFLGRRSASQGAERDHYQNQLNITGKALTLYKQGISF